MSTRPRRATLRDRLGRDALFQTSADLPRIVELDVAGIGPNPEQPRARLDPDTLGELKASIERHGLLQPILVRRGAGGEVALVAGQRRLEALRLLGRPTVPAIVVDGDPGEVALVENLQRQDLDPFEEARAVGRLIERFGYSQAEIGVAIGKKQSTVSALLSLNRLPETIRRDYAAGEGVSRSVLVEIAQIDDPEQQEALWRAVKGRAVTVRDLRAGRRGAGPAAAPASDPARRVAALARGGERLARDLAAADTALAPELIERLRALRQALTALIERPAPSRRRR